MHELIGARVEHRKTRRKGKIIGIENKNVIVSYPEGDKCYEFPSSLVDYLILEDEELQNKYMQEGVDSSFNSFKKRYKQAISLEINYLKETGGKRYRIIDGERMQIEENTYIYVFETDSELHFPDGTAIKLYFSEKIVSAHIIACEEFNVIIQSTEFIGNKIDVVEFTAESWQILEALVERIDELDSEKSPIAYEVACKGNSKINNRTINLGQEQALRKSTSQPITFIWGPPGTGKTTTLAKIALEHILNEKRVLMLSYSNVSVDGAVLKVAEMSDRGLGEIVRYGYPRKKELLEKETLISYLYVLRKNPDLAKKYKILNQENNRLKKKDPKRIEIRKEISKIRQQLLEQEKQLIQNAAFVATTVSKAVVDRIIYTQKFDVVIFDEASMAYVPQVVFAAGLAKEYFCCLGDFRQLPAIVQNPSDNTLKKDIFEHTGITSAIEGGDGHEWLVMLDCQYRMHPEIAKFVSKYMYDGILRSANGIYEHTQVIADLEPMEGVPMSLIDLSKTYSVCIKTMDGSRINLMSAMMCIKLAEKFVEEYKVGIITPYNAQSRLILAMIRDLQERDKKFSAISCATVHQFQGSEKPVVIYDAVDCFRMAYPSNLLTSQKNDIANRLFNVALTRTQGKFILVSNREYLKKKKLSKKLLFTKALDFMTNEELNICQEKLIKVLGTQENEFPEMFLGECDEVDSWERYLKDIGNATDSIFIDMPGNMDDDEDAKEQLIEVFNNVEKKNVKISIRIEENILLDKEFNKYKIEEKYVSNPITIIDNNIIWFGEPLSTAEFISEGEKIETKCFPCLRFEGKHTVKMLRAIL